MRSIEFEDLFGIYFDNKTISIINSKQGYVCKKPMPLPIPNPFLKFNQM